MSEETMGDRVVPLLGSLKDHSALLLGAGSVGSRAATELVRAGIGRVHVIDPDTVSPPNLARAEYTQADIGRRKTDALTHRLNAINPAAAVTSDAANLADLPHSRLSNLVATATIVGAFSDDNWAQGHLAHHAYHAGRPLVAAGLYAKAEAGEVVIVDPRVNPKPPCWFCTVGRGSAGAPPPKDYALGRLAAQAAIGPPIGIVTLTAVSAMLGLLAGPSRPAGKQVGRLVDDGRTLCIIGWAGFELTDRLYPHPHMAGPQAVWIQPKADAGCTVCGSHPGPPPDPQAIARTLRDLRRLASATGPESADQPSGPLHI